MSLLDRFREGSDFAAHGQFSLDGSRAKDKMAHFQLTRDEDFLLLIIQACVAAKSSLIEIVLPEVGHLPKITVVGHDMELDQTKLENLDEFLFDENPLHRSYTLLGIALNAIRLKCKEAPDLTLVDGCFRLDLILTERLGFLVDSITERVRYAPCKVELNKAPLKQVDLNKISDITFQEWGWSLVEVVRHGVLIETKRLEILPSFSAAVSDPQFIVDASFTHVIEDELFHGAVDSLYSKLLKTIGEFCSEFHEVHHRQMVRWLRELPLAHVPQTLAEASVFPAADRSVFYSFKELQSEWDSSGFLYTSETRYEIELGKIVVLCLDSEVQKTLEKLLRDTTRLRDSKELYLDRLTFLKNRELWENSPRALTLPPGEYKVTREISGRTWQAIIGIGLLGKAQENTISVLFQKRFLFTGGLSPFLPPGSQAVINFDTVEIDGLWSRAIGQTYYDASDAIDTEIRMLFESIECFDRSELSPAMEAYILDKLDGPLWVLPLAMTGTPIFPSADGEKFYSFDQLARRVLVYLGFQFVPKSKKFPVRLFPEPLLEYRDRTFKILKRRLKPTTSVIDYRRAFGRFEELDEQLLNPRETTLPELSYLARESFSSGNLRAEFGLFFERTPSWELVFIRQGVCLEKREIVLTKVLSARVVVECNDLEPKSDWSGIKKGKLYKSIRQSVRKKLAQMEKRFINSSSITVETKIKLLLAYPDLLQQAEEIGLFIAARGRKRYTMAELREEYENRKFFLTSQRSVHTAIEVRVLRAPPQEARALLQRVFGSNLRFEDAHDYLGLMERKAAFERAEVFEDIQLTGEFILRTPLEFGQGEMGVFAADEAKDGGKLQVFIDGRFAGTRDDVVPHLCGVALQHPEIQFNSDMTEFLIPSDLQVELRQQCQHQIFQYFSSENDALRALAFGYLNFLIYRGELPVQLQEYPILFRQDGRQFSLRDALEMNLKRIDYVSPFFDSLSELELPEDVFLNTGLEMEIICKASRGLLKRYNVSKILLGQKRDRDYLEALPRELQANLEFKNFEGKLLTAKLRVSDETSVLGFDKAGRLLGYLDWTGLPVTGHVFGLIPKWRAEGSVPEAEFEPGSSPELSRFASDLYYDWFQEQFNKKQSGEARAAAFRILSHSPNLIAGHRTHSESRLGQLLWDMPLFCLVNGTFTSGSTLATRFSDSQTPVLVSDTRSRAPGDALFLQPGSLEKGILSKVLGPGSVIRYEDPGILDTDRLKQNIKRLAGWGLSPLRSLTEMFRSRDDERQEAEPDYESLLLLKLHEDLYDLLGTQRAKEADGYFCRTDFGSWILGPPLYRSSRRGQFRFNRLNPSVKWLLQPEAETRKHRVARLLLLVRWIGLVNEESLTLTDEHESEFLVRLSDRVAQSLG